MIPFRPQIGGNSKLTASTSTQRLAIAGANPLLLRQFRFAAASGVIRVAFGTSTTTVADTDMAIQPGTIEVLSCPGGATHLCYKADTGTPTFEVTLGDGN